MFKIITSFKVEIQGKKVNILAHWGNTRLICDVLRVNNNKILVSTVHGNKEVLNINEVLTLKVLE